MKKINELSPQLIAEIAAGQVIERPSFAVKELIENAIDAGASEIKIYLEETGLRKIQVMDNGEGMGIEDLRESWKPHTTSKLVSLDDLHQISSLGFRGEALSSLAAVSKLTIMSREKGDKSLVGNQIIVEGGREVSMFPIGMKVGTVVIAEDLFTNLPARRKFLKSPLTELRHCIDTVTYFALSYPSIQFTLSHGKKRLLDFPETKDIAERTEQVIGSDVFSLYIPFKKNESYITVSGFLGKPQVSSGTQNKQFLFINRRKVNDKVVSQAVKESFGTMLESSRYPEFILFLSLPFEMVDVNVHPRKEQVAFLNNQFIFQTIKELIAEVLSENNITFQNLSWKRTGVGMTKSFAGDFLRETVLEKEKFLITQKTQISQLNNLYIVVSDAKGLLLIDQHAAHERILFEKLHKEFLQQKIKLFTLPKPLILHLTKGEEIILNEQRESFKKMRIVIQDNSVTHVPFLLQDRNIEDLIKRIIEDLSEGKDATDMDKISEEMLAFLACRAAVKSGDYLTEDQMRKIIKDLNEATHNATCPHGRPTRIFMSLNEIDTMFLRN